MQSFWSFVETCLAEIPIDADQALVSIAPDRTSLTFIASNKCGFVGDVIDGFSIGGIKLPVVVEHIAGLFQFPDADIFPNEETFQNGITREMFPHVLQLL
jgi:hypothetical protein